MIFVQKSLSKVSQRMKLPNLPKTSPDRPETDPRPTPDRSQTDPRPTPNRPQTDPRPTSDRRQTSLNFWFYESIPIFLGGQLPIGVLEALVGTPSGKPSGRKPVFKLFK